MAGRRIVYGGACSNSNTILLQNQRVSCSDPLDSIFLSGSSPSFLGSRSMVSFEDVHGGKRSTRSFFSSFDQEENADEGLDEYFNQPEKKRRLSPDQVRFLERSFEVENKLEPDRKIQLAKDLGLQPRQVAIWFQNRRARWKTKQLEKDYQALESSFNSLRAEYDGLLEEKEKLKSEVLNLADKLLLKQKQNGNSEPEDTNQNLQAPPEGTVDSAMACKQEDLSSAKSDVLDSDSPRYADGGHSSLLEPGDSSYVLEPDQSDLSQDEEDNFSKKLFPPPEYVFPKNEDADYPNPPSNSGYYGFPVEDHAFGFWSC
ncbi:Homeobox-leucine zipper protein [Actinidia chinensis var. chinensis]|uniref:Homeobox-leucine zipper protein n=1 Tax=Actinidia chinensis var. chinensis TaxID=1590841 RepID=A0A2R6PE55_ACTCC|nr:Homeobox-leucine zipper protein [Actinidia chinensis var. chinensis]